VIDPATEQRLLPALRSGDTAARDAAMHELHERMGRALFQLCMRVACDPNDAEDALQETYVDALRGIGAFRGEAKLATWLFRIAVRAATRVRSRGGPRRHADLADHEPVGGADPVAIAVERENAARLLAAIAELPAMQRTILGLASLQEFAHGDIAAVLGIPVGTVGSRLHEAKERLRERLAAAKRP
jgi:RNA polymerase sigma factor (sigma-70 family)